MDPEVNILYTTDRKSVILLSPGKIIQWDGHRTCEELMRAT
jgi:hypothetical protein